MANITLDARSSLSILAVSVFVVLSVGTTQNNIELIQLGNDMFKMLVFAIIAVTIIINGSKKTRK